MWGVGVEPQRYSLFNLIFFSCPDPLIRICMTLRSHVVYRRQLLLQTPVHLLLFSIFVVRADCRESARTQSSKSNYQNAPKPVLFFWRLGPCTHLTKGSFSTCVIRATLHASPFAFFPTVKLLGSIVTIKQSEDVWVLKVAVTCWHTPL